MRKRVPVIVFHRIHPDYDRFTQPIPPSEFSKYLDLLTKRYNVYSLSDFPNSDPKACYLTFDDATNDFYEFAYPLIKERKIPATLFVPAESVSQGIRIWNNEFFYSMIYGRNESINLKLGAENVEVQSGVQLRSVLNTIELINKIPEGVAATIAQLKKKFNPVHSDFANPMTWEQLREVQGNKIQIGNHSFTHRDYSTLNEEKVINDIGLSQSLIASNLGKKPKAFAFPMGKKGYMKLLAREFDCICTTEAKLSSGKGKEMPRISIYDRSAEEMILRTSGFHGIMN